MGFGLRWGDGLPHGMKYPMDIPTVAAILASRRDKPKREQGPIERAEPGCMVTGVVAKATSGHGRQHRRSYDRTGVRGEIVWVFDAIKTGFDFFYGRFCSGISENTAPSG